MYSTVPPQVLLAVIGVAPVFCVCNVPLWLTVATLKVLVPISKIELALVVNEPPTVTLFAAVTVAAVFVTLKLLNDSPPAFVIDCAIVPLKVTVVFDEVNVPVFDQLPATLIVAPVGVDTNEPDEPIEMFPPIVKIAFVPLELPISNPAIPFDAEILRLPPIVKV